MIKISTAYKCVHIEIYNVTEAFSILSASLYLLGMSIALLFSFYVYGHEIIFCFGLYWYLNSSYCYFALLTRLTTFGVGFLCKIARVVAIFFFFLLFSLCKMCPFSELFWSAFFPHFPAFGLNTERYDLRIQSECGKMRENVDQNNTEYGLFLRSVYDKDNVSEYSQPSKAKSPLKFLLCQICIKFS